MIAKSIPSLLTVGNLFLGIVAIIMIFDENPQMAAIMVLIAMLLDGVDGRVARALNVQSEFGKELDSLSDVISFGVAPAFIMYVVAFQDLSPALAWTVTALFPICGALRLARFNVITSNAGYFIGLPIPAAGGVLATMALFKDDIPVAVLLTGTIVLALLMVSTVRYPNFKKVGIPRNAIWVVPIIIIISIIIGINFENHLSKFLFVPLLIYALYGLKKNVDRRLPKRLRKRKNQNETPEEPVNSEKPA
ncbi:CDP-diacylglycerol--serine O-phosphatidyltransferase [Paenibacillus sp. GSMTC-2017]|uniref:CDP-diacylglycerol--serine O-phosphatidyltransferase n=1 Tax=Paenibacillus sp. GSMTC-2017 TaxID=2794350 RepID=UPI0018D9304B|nr:CDP-diacylglycerol--serine O-phosphatidyltransferase [Paenibacillus sp. GSMTC-2017]MBH5320827.1 CDP-diacylglycerol--serine O-phosphatidyltransferase [Paenibacillus sp. GSMTC-2017]